MRVSGGEERAGENGGEAKEGQVKEGEVKAARSRKVRKVVNGELSTFKKGNSVGPSASATVQVPVLTGRSKSYTYTTHGATHATTHESTHETTHATTYTTCVRKRQN